jgi:hypothetical protein
LHNVGHLCCFLGKRFGERVLNHRVGWWCSWFGVSGSRLSCQVFGIGPFVLRITKKIGVHFVLEIVVNRLTFDGTSTLCPHQYLYMVGIVTFQGCEEGGFSNLPWHYRRTKENYRRGKNTTFLNQIYTSKP